MGAFLSSASTFDNVSRLASPDVCDEETWGNTLRNRSTHTVHDHLEGLVVPDGARVEPTFITDAICEEFPISFAEPICCVAEPTRCAAKSAIAEPPLCFVEPVSPSSSSSSLSSFSSTASSRRRRLEFAASNTIAFYSVDAPPEEMFGHDRVHVM